jgi:hypothetical protein
MFGIPSDLDRWHPADTRRWLTDLANNESVSDWEFATAQAAAHHARVGTSGNAAPADGTRLDCLVDRAARGVATPEEGAALRRAVAELREQRDQFADRVDTLTAVVKSNGRAHKVTVLEVERLARELVAARTAPSATT